LTEDDHHDITKGKDLEVYMNTYVAGNDHVKKTCAQILDTNDRYGSSVSASMAADPPKSSVANMLLLYEITLTNLFLGILVALFIKGIWNKFAYTNKSE